MYLWGRRIYNICQYSWKSKAVDSPLQILWKCAWWDNAEDGWVVKKSVFSLLTALISAKMFSLIYANIFRYILISKPSTSSENSTSAQDCFSLNHRSPLSIYTVQKNWRTKHFERGQTDLKHWQSVKCYLNYSTVCTDTLRIYLHLN